MKPSRENINENALRIRKAMKHLGVSPESLGVRIGLSETTIRTAWLSKGQQPNTAQCLMLAGLTDEIGDRDYWLKESGLSYEQLRLIAKGLGVSGVASSGTIIQAIADLVADPHDDMDRHLVQLLMTVIEHRARIKSR
jgi:hypothetical protein